MAAFDKPHGKRLPRGLFVLRLMPDWSSLKGAGVRFGRVSMLAGIGLMVACVHPPRERAESGVELGYPDCGAEELPEGERVADGTLRAGPVMLDSSLVERFEVRRRGCVTVFSGEQDWSHGSTDLDVVYDSETLLPLRAWKRVLSPGPQPLEERVVTRRFELRSERVALSQRSGAGPLEHWWIRGRRPSVVLGPGRGLLTMWLRRARLAVGGRTREAVLDIRESMEVVRDVSLLRLADRFVPALGRSVRVYTIYGREPFFADDDDVVVGDLMGLVPAARVDAPLPAPVIEPSPADPVHTP